MIKRYHSVTRALSARAKVNSRALAGVILIVCLSGCSLQPPAVMAWGPPSEAPSEKTVVGDWEDVDAAVRTALRQCQLVQEQRSEYREAVGGEITIVDYNLLTVRGDSGRLRVLRGGDGSLELTCRIGVLGSAEAERCVIEHLEARLTALHGVDFAPLVE